jgi:hypothetical protein
MRFDACKTASLHYCLEDVGALAADGAVPIQLEPQIFVLLPPGRRRLRYAENSRRLNHQRMKTSSARGIYN